MRNWLAVLIWILAVAGGTTALALAGGEQTEPGTTESVQPETGKLEIPSIDDEVIPKGMLEDDETPEKAERPKDEHPEEEHKDTTRPEIVILHPEDGQVFERKEVVFEGETEPGARVFAGKYEADVSESGAWRIVLHLYPGDNNVKIKAIDEAGNVGFDTVLVKLYVPKEEKAETPKEQPKEEEKPKEEKPEMPKEWEFSAHQLYGECGETPPYDVFHGTGKPGTLVHVKSEFGSGVAEVGEQGGWEIKVIFEHAPVGKVFAVYVKDDFGNKKTFEFVHTD